MMTDTMMTMIDTLENLGVSEESISMVMGINGQSEDTLEDILYYWTGYRKFEDLEENF